MILNIIDFVCFVLMGIEILVKLIAFGKYYFKLKTIDDDIDDFGEKILNYFDLFFFVLIYLLGS